MQLANSNNAVRQSATQVIGHTGWLTGLWKIWQDPELTRTNRQTVIRIKKVLELKDGFFINTVRMSSHSFGLVSFIL